MRNHFNTLLIIAAFAGIAEGQTIYLPTPSSTITTTNTTFCWSQSNTYVTMRFGLSKIAFGQSEAGTQTTVNGGNCYMSSLVLNGGTLYATLWYTITGGATTMSYASYMLSGSSGPTAVEILSPANGSKLLSTTLTLTFSPPRFYPFYVWVGSLGLDSNNLFSDAVYGTTLTVTVPTALYAPAINVLTAAVENGLVAYRRVQYMTPNSNVTVTGTLYQGFDDPPPGLPDDYPTAATLESRAVAPSVLATTRPVRIGRGIARFGRADLLNVGNVTYERPVQVDKKTWEYSYSFDSTEVQDIILGSDADEDIDLNVVSSEHPKGWLRGSSGWGVYPEIAAQAERSPNAVFKLRSTRLPGLTPLNLASVPYPDDVSAAPHGHVPNAQELQAMARARDSRNNGKRTYVIGPSLLPDPKPETVRAYVQWWVDDYGFTFLRPLLEGSKLGELQPSTQLETDIVECLRRADPTLD